MPIVINLVDVVLDLILHRLLLVRQSLELAPHDARVVFEQSPPGHDVACAAVEDLGIDLLLFFLVFLLLAIDILHVCISVQPILLVLVVVVVLLLAIALHVIQILERRHLGGADVLVDDVQSV